jgi:hypothetical protein
MLGTYFDESNGLVSFGDYHVAFAPEGEFRGEAVVINEQTEVLARYPFFPEYFPRNGVFGRVRIQGPADAQLTTPGTYYLVFLVDGQPASRLPFVMRQTSAGNDPFNPEKTFAFDGYWRTFAYLTMTTYKGASVPELNFWVGGIDLADAASRDGLFAELRRGDATVAHSRRTVGSIAPGRLQWQKISLFHPHTERETPNAELFMLSDWQANDGAYELRISRSADGKMIRSFDFEVSAGKIQPHPRSALGYEPRFDYLLPRVVDHGASSFDMVEAIWIEDRTLR